MFGGEIFVPKIPSIKITDLAKAISPSAKFKIIGIRPGEKIHEAMCIKEECEHTFEFKDFYVIFPSGKSEIKNRYFKKLKGKRLKNNFSYNSRDNNFLNIGQLKKLIRKI